MISRNSPVETGISPYFPGSLWRKGEDLIKFGSSIQQIFQDSKPPNLWIKDEKTP